MTSNDRLPEHLVTVVTDRKQISDLSSPAPKSLLGGAERPKGGQRIAPRFSGHRLT